MKPVHRIEKQLFTTHEKLFEAVIFSVNEEQSKPIAGAYELLKEVWFFLNSDNATFNGKKVEKYKRPLFVNPVIIGKPKFDEFFEAEITYSSTRNKIKILEQDFITDIGNWIEKKSKDESLSILQKRKFNEFLKFLKTKTLPPQPILTNSEILEPKLSDLITNENSVEIVRAIKIQYKNIGGKRLKILLMSLQDLNLLPKERIAKKFHDCCKKEFNWNIKSYNAMNDYTFNEITDNEDLNEMKEFIQRNIQ